MIPQFNASGVLPPFVGCNAAQEATMMSPYPVDMMTLVELARCIGVVEQHGG